MLCHIKRRYQNSKVFAICTGCLTYPQQSFKAYYIIYTPPTQSKLLNPINFRIVEQRAYNSFIGTTQYNGLLFSYSNTIEIFKEVHTKCLTKHTVNTLNK